VRHRKLCPLDDVQHSPWSVHEQQAAAKHNGRHRSDAAPKVHFLFLLLRLSFLLPFSIMFVSVFLSSFQVDSEMEAAPNNVVILEG
jgi:hypothetical protein